MNIRHLIATAIVILLALPLRAQNAPDGYYIKNYHVEMVVHENNKYSISEDIDVCFTEPRHGIFRMIPISPYVNRDVSEKQDGSNTEIRKYSVSISNIRVNADYEKEYKSSLCQLRIGSAERYVTGDQHYLIQYVLELPYDRVEQADLLFYSVLGSGWNCDVQNFSFHVTFDKPLPQSALDCMQVFAGEEGSHDDLRSSILTKQSATELEGGMKNIEPHEAITLYIPLPEAYFSFFLWQDKAAWICLILSFLLIAYVLFKEFFRPSEVIKILTVTPPDKMSSAEVGTLFDCSVDDCDVISLIPWFASKGYISIDNTGEHPVLKKLKDLPPKSPTYQRTLFNAFFPDTDHKEFNTGENTSRDFGKSWLKAKDELTKRFHGKLDNVDKSMFLTYVVALFLASFTICFATCNDGFFIGGITTIGFGFITFVMLSSSMSATKKKSSLTVIGCLVGIAVAGLVLSYNMVMNDGEFYIPINPIFCMLFLLGIASIYSTQMTVMTPYRRERMGEILGLEEFVRLSEEPQLRQLQADEERYFYDILPYAVAFGMSEIWAKKFENITVKPNENFICNDNGMVTPFMASNFTSHFMTPAFKAGINAETEARREAAARASSSGSSHSSSSSYGGGGGGYSGGGFGGGGGGSW